MSLVTPRAAGAPGKRGRRLLLLPLAALLLAAAPAWAQTGTVAGTVSDAEYGETLPGVNIVVEGTTTGTTTDLDGAYALRLAPGTYSLVFSYVGFTAQTVRGVVVTAGATTPIDLQMGAGSAELGEVVVEAEALQGNTEDALLRTQARAPAIMDGIAATQIRRSPDSNSGEALRRVTGVTVTGGRFIFVRGVPERYNGTLLIGVPVPSTEPDRRAFTYDLIPSSLLNNVQVAKSATPDLPGDFAGGMLSLNTIDFPDQFTASGSIASSFNNTTGGALVAGPRGATDFLAYDDGLRDIPAGIPAENLGGGDLTDAQRGELGRLLNNNWVLTQRDGPVTPNFSFSLGGSERTPIGRIGAIAAAGYRSSYNRAEIERAEFQSDSTARFAYTGQQYGYNVTWGGIANLSYRPSALHSLSFQNFYTRTADDVVTQLAGTENTELVADLRQTAMQYVDRGLYVGRLGGQHVLRGVGGGSGTELNWTGFRAVTSRNEPDFRRAIYARPLDDSTAAFNLLIGPQVALSNGGRYYSNLDERSWGGTADATVPVGALRFKLGGLAELRDRSFTSRLLGAVLPRQASQFDFGLLALPLDSIFAAENFGHLDRPGCEAGGPGCEGFRLSELRSGGTDYTAGQDVTAGFVMLDAPLAPISRRLRFVGGVRLEHAVQRIEAVGFEGDSLDLRQPYTNLLPSANLTYNLAERTNLRFAYSRNVNRPELRELAPIQYYDFEIQTTVYGNDSLRQATINNLDLRFETYPGAGEILSASLFFKHFDSPIERAIVPGVSLSAERTFTNAERAVNYGFEVEARKSLGFLSPYLERSNVVANYTWVHSDVTTPGSATVLERTGRPLQGQSPYVINLGATFVEPRYGTSLSVLYNRLGSRIIDVASAFEADVIEEGRDLLDLALIQPIAGRYELRVTARDLFNQPTRVSQGGLPTRATAYGRSVSVGFSARF